MQKIEDITGMFLEKLQVITKGKSKYQVLVPLVIGSQTQLSGA